MIINNLSIFAYSLDSMEKEVLALLDKGIGPKKFRIIAMVTYSLKNLNHSQKTLFGYALKGRTGQKGFLDQLKGEVVGRNNVLIPIDNLDRIMEFFSTWKVRYEVRKFVELKQ